MKLQRQLNGENKKCKVFLIEGRFSKCFYFCFAQPVFRWSKESLFFQSGFAECGVEQLPFNWIHNNKVIKTQSLWRNRKICETIAKLYDNNHVKSHPRFTIHFLEIMIYV